MTDKEFRTLKSNNPKSAQRMFFDEYVNYVYAIVFSKLRSTASHEDIEECVEDVFFDFFRSYEIHGDFNGELKYYIGTIAKNKAVDMYRRLSAENSKFTDVEEEKLLNLPSDYDIREKTEKNELQRILLKKIEELGEPDSTIVFQKYFCERTSVEIGKMIKLPASIVRVRCGRAMKKLKKLLAEVGITGERG